MRWPRSVERDEARGRVCADSPGTDRYARPGCSHPSDAASLPPLILRGNSPPSRRLPARTGCGLTAYPYSEPVHEAAKMRLPWCSLSPAQQPGCGCVLPRRRVGSKPARPALAAARSCATASSYTAVQLFYQQPECRLVPWWASHQSNQQAQCSTGYYR